MTSTPRTAVKALNRVLAGLDPPAVLAGETMPPGAREMLLTGDGFPRRGAQLYGENGEPINLRPREGWAKVAEIRDGSGGEVRTAMRTERGVPLWVSTVYLGVDMSVTGTLPLIWETLVFVGDKELELLEPIRYATRAAAHAGHKSVVTALHESAVRAR